MFIYLYGNRHDNFEGGDNERFWPRVLPRGEEYEFDVPSYSPDCNNSGSLIYETARIKIKSRSFLTILLFIHFFFRKHLFISNQCFLCITFIVYKDLKGRIKREEAFFFLSVCCMYSLDFESDLSFKWNIPRNSFCTNFQSFKER